MADIQQASSGILGNLNFKMIPRSLQSLASGRSAAPSSPRGGGEARPAQPVAKPMVAQGRAAAPRSTPKLPKPAPRASASKKAKKKVPVETPETSKSSPFSFLIPTAKAQEILDSFVSDDTEEIPSSFVADSSSEEEVPSSFVPDEQPSANAAIGRSASREELLKRAMQVMKERKDKSNPLADFGNFVLGSTVKPIAQGLASPFATGARAAQAAYEGGKSLISGEGLETAGKKLESTYSEPVDVPWLGNLNIVKKDKSTGGVNKFGTAASSVGTLADTVSGFANILNPIAGGFKHGLLRGGTQAASQAAKEEDASLESIGLSGLIGGGIGGLFGGAPNVINKLRDLRGKAAGLSEDAINTLKNPKLGKNVLPTVKIAEKSMANPVENLNPLQKVGQEQFKPALKQLVSKNQNLGKELGTFIKESGVKSNLKSVYDDFATTLEKFGGKIKNTPNKTSEISPYSTFLDNVKTPSSKGGKISVQFGEFSGLDNPSDIKEINNFLNIINKYRTKKVEASDIHDLIQKISTKLDYSSKTAVPLSTPAEAILKDLRTSASNLLKTKVKGSSKLFDQMSKNYDAIDFFNPKLGDNSSSAGVLKNLFSPQRKDELLPMLERLQQETGTNILNPTRIAKTAMDIAGDTRGDSLLNAPGIKALLAKIAQATIANPKGTAKSLVKAGLKKGVTGLPQGLLGAGNVLPLDLTNALKKLLKSSPQNSNNSDGFIADSEAPPEFIPD